MIADTIQASLESEGMRVTVARDGDQGVDCFRGVRPDLVLLDLVLPGISGFDVCRQVRAESNVPIIIVTARSSEADRVLGLEIGADDYLTKPFSLRELISRARAQLRRAGMDGLRPAGRLLAGPVRIDTERHEVWVRELMVDFPPKEFRLLEALVRAQGRVRTRSSLIDEVWDPNYVGDTKTLDVHMRRLRRKIERDPHSPEHILTVRGIGYRYVSEGKQARRDSSLLRTIDSASSRLAASAPVARVAGG